jgi:hypothetical protein
VEFEGGNEGEDADDSDLPPVATVDGDGDALAPDTNDEKNDDIFSYFKMSMNWTDQFVDE